MALTTKNLRANLESAAQLHFRRTAEAAVATWSRLAHGILSSQTPSSAARRQASLVTFCTFHRWILPNAVREIALRCCLHDNDAKHFLHAAVVMPDHVHLIFTPLLNSEKREIYSLAEIMGAIKGASAQLINRELNRRGRVWQTESFDRVLRSSESLDSKVAYVLENPVRKGLANRWEDYPWVWRRREDNPYTPDKKRLAVLGGTAEAAVPT